MLAGQEFKKTKQRAILFLTNLPLKSHGDKHASPNISWRPFNILKWSEKVKNCIFHWFIVKTATWIGFYKFSDIRY